METLRKYFYLSLSDKGLLVKSAFLVIAIRLGLSLFSFKRILKLVDIENNNFSGIKNKNRVSLDRITWSVETCGRYIPKTTCLIKALTAQVLLTRYGYQSKLHIGVAKNGDKNLDAHAWVESQGNILIGNLKDLSKFAPLSTLKDYKL